MPNDSWFGLKFLDVQYLGNWNFSPNLEVFKSEGLFKVKLSGNHEVEPALCANQIAALTFLGWTQDSDSACDCFFFASSEVGASVSKAEEAIDDLQIVYRIQDSCIIRGSNDYVDSKIEHLPTARFNRKLGGYKLSSSLYNRIDLR
jgi:hypothetical protein